MKNNILHNRLIHALFILMSLFMLNNLQAQTSKEDLQGTWSLDMAEITKQWVTEKHTLESLYADKENLPRNMFIRLYFFDGYMSVDTTESEFLPGEKVNSKGTFIIDDGKLIVTMRNEQPRIFTYSIEDEFLKVWYTQEDTEFYLVYKLFNNNES